ncbi:MAG TPA: class I SAM-dependent methyltransferase [Steroidobacteraceae bacterium]|jgi:malonyl-CoA O-methyltransferase
MSAAETSTLQAYERWAPEYPPVAHNPLMRAEQCSMLQVWPNMEGSVVLDLACGSGRYSRLLKQANAAQVVALDFCVPMLEQVATADRVRGSMMQLPFRPAVFDAVISGLAVGHATDIHEWMSEVARVLRPEGTLVYSDFHSEAIRAGMTRSFKDAADVTWTVPHQIHDLSCQKEAMSTAGLTVDTVRELRMGMELNERFPGSEKVYRQWYGVPVVLVVRACKR